MVKFKINKNVCDGRFNKISKNSKVNNGVLAITIDGRLTKCTAAPENIGRGRCNHVAHSKNGESEIDFAKRVEEFQNINNLMNESIEVKLLFIDREIGLDYLINDENRSVRAAIAEKGLYLDKLIDDKDPDVRA